MFLIFYYLKNRLSTGKDGGVSFSGHQTKKPQGLTCGFVSAKSIAVLIEQTDSRYLAADRFEPRFFKKGRKNKVGIEI